LFRANRFSAPGWPAQQNVNQGHPL
jgi:hypothetical protein